MLRREAEIHQKPKFPTSLQWEALVLGVSLITVSVLGFVWMLVH